MIRSALYTAFLALALCFGMLWLRGMLAPAEIPSPAPSVSAETAPPAPASAAPALRRVRVKDGGDITEMALEDYLVGVVAAEMPAAVAERPPENAPRIPCSFAPSIAPFASALPKPKSGTLAPAPAKSTSGS